MEQQKTERNNSSIGIVGTGRDVDSMILCGSRYGIRILDSEPGLSKLREKIQLLVIFVNLYVPKR
jgi:hypothetical protein